MTYHSDVTEQVCCCTAEDSVFLVFQGVPLGEVFSKSGWCSSLRHCAAIRKVAG